MSDTITVVKTFAAGKKMAHVSTTELQHPNSLNESTWLENRGLNVSLSVFPQGKEEAEHICISVFVNGDQHVIFSGTINDAKDFFTRFPKN